MRTTEFLMVFGLIGIAVALVEPAYSLVRRGGMSVVGSAAVTIVLTICSWIIAIAVFYAIVSAIAGLTTLVLRRNERYGDVWDDVYYMVLVGGAIVAVISVIVLAIVDFFARA